MCVAPVARAVDVPIRILNAHEDSSYDYRSADTAIYLRHEGVCCIPKYAGTLIELGRKFKIRTGHFGDPRFWSEVKTDCTGAAAARVFKGLNFGVIGKTYDGMTDMPIDEHRLLKTTGRLVDRPEVEEIENAFNRVTPGQVERMFVQLRDMYDVDETVTNEHLRISAQLAVAYDERSSRSTTAARSATTGGGRRTSSPSCVLNPHSQCLVSLRSIARVSPRATSRRPWR
jgi:L-arabinose isomerase